LSASSLVAWFSGIDERLGAQNIEGESPGRLAIAPTQPPANVLQIIKRDPFAESASPLLAGSSESALDDDLAQDDETPGLDSTVAADSVVVPNIGAPDVAATSLVVRATITGPNPVAYVENGSEVDIVRVGDTLGDRRVSVIDLRGITFGDGSRLDLPSGYTATPSPIPLARSITLRVDDLRRLLQARPVNAPQPVAPAPSRAPASVPDYPTPGPLPTVNPQGLPPGVTPSPDYSAPTGFPYPYPYAPALR
jgi:hypothetical protein